MQLSIAILFLTYITCSQRSGRDTGLLRVRDPRRLEYSDVSGGRTHKHKAEVQRLLETLIADRQRLLTDAEVLQEILLRYVASIAGMPFSLRLMHPSA